LFNGIGHKQKPSILTTKIQVFDEDHRCWKMNKFMKREVDMLLKLRERRKSRIKERPNEFDEHLKRTMMNKV